MTEPNDAPEPTARYVAVDLSGLRELSAEERFAACRSITNNPPQQVKDMLVQAVVELRQEYGDAHGGNAAVARRLGVTPTYVSKLLDRAREDGETYEQTSERLDREMVEDFTAHPDSWLRQVEGIPDMLDLFVDNTVEAAQNGEWETAKAGLYAMIRSLQSTLDSLEGRTIPELVAEAEQIQAGEAPWQQHTYRRRVTYQDATGAWVESSDTLWEADNDQTIQEVAEDSGYLVASFFDRMGEYTPGRVWKIELWADPDATGDPDQVHKYVEEAPPADQVPLADAIADGRLVRDGKIDRDLVEEFIASRAQGTDKDGGQL